MKSITIRSFSSPVYQTQRDCLLPRTSSQHEPWAGKFPPGFSQFQEKESKDVKKNHGKKSNFHLKKVSQLSCIQSMSNPYPILSKPPKNFTDLQLVLRAWTCRNLIRVLAVVRSPLTDGSDGIFPWVFLWKSMTSMAYGYIACEVCTEEGEHEAPCLPLAQVSQGSDRLMKDVAVHLGWFATHCLRTCGPVTGDIPIWLIDYPLRLPHCKLRFTGPIRFWKDSVSCWSVVNHNSDFTRGTTQLFSAFLSFCWGVWSFPWWLGGIERSCLWLLTPPVPATRTVLDHQAHWQDSPVLDLLDHPHWERVRHNERQWINPGHTRTQVLVHFDNDPNGLDEHHRVLLSKC